jgi:hypothetical protein
MNSPAKMISSAQSQRQKMFNKNHANHPILGDGKLLIERFNNAK